MSYGYLLRAKETTLVTSTNNADLEGVSLGSPFQSLVDGVKAASGVGTGPWTIEVVIANTTDWEHLVCQLGEGTGTGGKDLLSRSTATVIDSSNAGSLVNWGSGTKDVFAFPSNLKAGALFDKLSTVGVVKRLGDSSYSILTTGATGEALLDDATQADARTTIDAQQDVIVARGDLVVGNATPAASALTIGAAAKYLRSDGTDPGWSQIPGTEVTYSATSPLTATTVQAAIDQLNIQRPSTTNQTTTQDNILTAEVEVSDLDNLTIPGSPDGTKAYVVLGQVTVKGQSTGGSNTCRLRVGPNGNKTDTLIAEHIIANGIVNNSTVPIPPKPFTPAAGDKVTITMQATDGACDIDARAVATFASIVQLTNV